MSVIVEMQRKDLIGATIIDVDGRDDSENNMYDLTKITLELSSGKTVCVTVDRYEDTCLDVDTVW